MRKVSQKSMSGKVESFMPGDQGTERSSTWDIVSVDEAAEAEDLTKREEGTHGVYCELNLVARKWLNGQRSKTAPQPSPVVSTTPSSSRLCAVRVHARRSSSSL